MSVSSPELAALAHLLPEERVGAVAAVRPIAMGLSGASVYAVSSARGELVLRVSAGHGDASHWAQQLRVWRRAAERGVAPAIVHVDEAARAVVSVRAGVPLASALADPGQRGAAIAGVVAQLRALRALDTVGVAERDPLALARASRARGR